MWNTKIKNKFSYYTKLWVIYLFIILPFFLIIEKTYAAECGYYFSNSNECWKIDPVTFQDLGQIFPFANCFYPNEDRCCAYINDCRDIVRPTPTPTPGPPTFTPAPTPTPKTFTPYEAPSNSFFDMLNPLKHAGGDDIFEDEASAYADQLSTPGGIVSRLLAFAFPLAGLILFVMLVWGGFEILIQAPSKKGIDAGKQRVSAAIIGFILLFSSYWIWQIVEVVFGIVIF